MSTQTTKSLSSKLLLLQRQQQQHICRRGITNTSSKAAATSAKVQKGYIQPPSPSPLSSSSNVAVVKQSYRPFATALSDVMSPSLHEQQPQNSAVIGRDWSGNFSFASPESDFTFAVAAARINDDADEYEEGEWSHALNYASPESDFTSSPLSSTPQDQEEDAKEAEWSHALSFASPDSDFTSAHQAKNDNDRNFPSFLPPSSDDDDEEYREMRKRYLNYLESEENSHHRGSMAYSLSLASPEADFTSPLATPLLSESMKAQLENSTNQLVRPELEHNNKKDEDAADQKEYMELRERYLNHLEADENSHHRGSMAYSLSLASPEADFTSPHVTPLLSDTMKAQLENATNQLFRDTANEDEVKKEHQNQQQSRPLPRSYSQAIQHQSGAIVITSKCHPFRIVSVNDAWTNLCGYTQEESYGKTLKSLLHGPETNGHDVQDMMLSLKNNEDGEKTVVNYTKNGRRFVNKVKVGPLRDEITGEVTHFVGLLSEIVQGDEDTENKKKVEM